MQHGEDVDDVGNPAGRPSSGLRPVHPPARGEAPKPSFGKVALLIGVGCLTFVGLMSVIVVVGVSAIWTMVNDHFEAEARQAAAEAARFTDFVAFKPGDPLPEPPLDLPRPPPP